MQRDRRSDPYPWTWELPVTACVATLLILLGGVQLGRSAANLVSGAGWTWPARQPGSFPSPMGAAFWSSLTGILSGDASAGLGSPLPDGLASAPALWATITVVQLLLVVALSCVGSLSYRRWGPGRMRGMASSAEAEKLLGITRLRKVAGIVRPDLHGRHTPPPAPVQRTVGHPDDVSNLELGRGLSSWLLPSRAKGRVRR